MQDDTVSNNNTLFTEARKPIVNDYDDEDEYVDDDTDEIMTAKANALTIKKRNFKKQKKTSQQLEILRKNFIKLPFWDKHTIDHLSSLTGLEPKQVYKWFWDHLKKVRDGRAAFFRKDLSSQESNVACRADGKTARAKGSEQVFLSTRRFFELIPVLFLLREGKRGVAPLHLQRDRCA
jgi:hypothetical protein